MPSATASRYDPSLAACNGQRWPLFKETLQIETTLCKGESDMEEQPTCHFALGAAASLADEE
jgi:hypothetical protein